MQSQPTSMIGHMYAASQRTMRVMTAPLRFVGRAAVQALERLVPHGASEIGQALYGGGSAYAPPGVTERLTDPRKEPPRQTHEQALQQAQSRAAYRPQQQARAR